MLAKQGTVMFVQVVYPILCFARAHRLHKERMAKMMHEVEKTKFLVDKKREKVNRAEHLGEDEEKGIKFWDRSWPIKTLFVSRMGAMPNIAEMMEAQNHLLRLGVPYLCRGKALKMI